jgi:hypothetical protein
MFKGLALAFALLYDRVRSQHNRARKQWREAKENRMCADVNMAKQAIHDKFETQIKIAEAKLDMVKAQAESAKADAEIKVLAELLARKRALQLELKALKKLGGDRWEQAKADLEAHIAHFEKLLKDAESKAKAG